ncbi:zinc chelation protein SecC [Variovorax paradoxus]|uniref:Zinc chelation protein SecC n=1 Tax=Variovorax paradoxus TaxID=34073 RepID=A0A6I6HNK7_VARPD|nr:zinc chelation protein SecC [Variovorax paradoxus]QGW84405.1 zinc chelation protein SecC [Variovorax paradoxus]
MVNQKNRELLDGGTLAAAMAAFTGSLGLRQIAAQCKPLVRDLRGFQPVRLAATYAGLLLQPSLQTNCLRLEALVHLSVAFGDGLQAATSPILLKGFSAIGLAYGHLEDPAEDVFVGNIFSRRGNFLVLEGTWESATFYLQRVVEMIDELPEQPRFQAVVDAVYALLTLSDLVCRRAGLQRNQLGSEIGLKVLPKQLVQQRNELQKLVQFSMADLAQAGLKIDHLLPFVFGPDGPGLLRDQSIDNSELERRPIAVADGSLFLLLPTAVTAAIRRFFIETLGTDGNREIFLHRLTYQYANLLSRSPLLGRAGPMLPFQRGSWGSICGVASEVDVGQHLAVVFVVDTLHDFHPEGLRGIFKPTDELRHQVEKAIAHVQKACSDTKGFERGVLLIVFCGVGRGAAFTLDAHDRSRWKVQNISAANFHTLGWMREMEPLQLWRLFRAQDQLTQMGVSLQNMNGLLNLVAWADSQHGHLVPHADIPVEAAGKKFSVAIQQNALLEARRAFNADWDMHAEQFIDGSWRFVQTDGQSHFSEENQRPLYGEVEPTGGTGLMGMFSTGARAWWFELASPEGGVFTGSYERWQMLGTWCRRSADHFEEAFAEGLGPGPVLWKCIFIAPQVGLDPEQPGGTADDAARAIEIDVQTARRTVQLTIGADFDRALYNPLNVAEAALVRALIAGVARLSGELSVDTEELLRKIVPNTQARQSHVFAAREFRDYFPELGEKSLINISAYEDGATRLGLGWKVHDMRNGGIVTGRRACSVFLNSLVRRLEDELSEYLRGLDRLDVLSKVLLNHEVAAVSRSRWHRTSAAILALRTDAAAALGPMRDQEFKLNAVFHGSRVLSEMAVCDCSLEGGRQLGRLDHSLLLTLASQINQLGGWSDLIHWGLMESKIVIRPLGDVHVEHDFVDSVIEQFGSKTSEVRYKDSARGYEKNLRVPSIAPDARSGGLDQEFLDAWVAEFGVELDAFRRFVDAVENHGIEMKEPVFVLRRSALEELAGDLGIGRKIVTALSLLPRLSWRQVPEGHDDRDISSWRFRRRLGLLRRPLLQFTDDADPQMLCAPGPVREGFSSMVGNYYYGTYADRHLGPAMRKYAGHARRRDGHEFNASVSAKIETLGWKTHSEIALTKVLARKLDRNYGDVDVLAWDVGSRRVLVIECKDLQFRKTYGEIAEQLMDFAGEVDEDGKRDLLRKHLDRVELLRSHAAVVARFLGLGDECVVESHLVFKNPVPMQFAKGPLTQCIQHTFDDLDDDLRLVETAASAIR